MMKAFKGCTNPNCKAYKKIHYKKEDQFCVKCGQKLEFVCAECWKPMEEDKEKYCISCMAEKEQKRAQIADKAKKNGVKVLSFVAVVANVAMEIGNHADKFAKGAKKAANAGEKIVKIVKK